MNNRLAQLKKASGVFAHGLFAPDQTCMCHSRPRLHDFQSGKKFVFSLHDTRMKFHVRRRISFGLKTRQWTHYGMTCIGMKCHLIGIMQTIQKNIWRWNELVPEWKSLGYDVPWLAGLVKRMTVSASGEGLSASSFSSSSSPPSASVFWKCESNIIDFLLLHVRLLWKAGLWNSPQFFLPAQSYQVKCSTLKINISV